MVALRCALVAATLCGTSSAFTPVGLKGSGLKSLRRPSVSKEPSSSVETLLTAAPPKEKVKETGKMVAGKESDSSIRQILGVRGAGDTEDLWKIRVQLMKPVTWIPLIWGVVCGAAASGNYHTFNPFDPSAVPAGLAFEDFLKSFACMILAGPLLTGFTQTINDWYDREIDAINEPYRPIPSGRISEDEVKQQIWGLLLAGLALAYGLDQWAGHERPDIFLLSLFGSGVSYIYSAPPLKLKQSGWIGNYALGSSYISLPWWCGQLMFGSLNWQTVVLTLLYSIAGVGIATVNDFKSVEGDRALGLHSLPVAFGIDRAKWIAAGLIDVTQLGVAAYIASLGEDLYAGILLGLIIPQMILQKMYLLEDPVEYDVKYQASAQPFLVFGILTTALACGSHFG
uniref:Chlorophyll synthase n=1 Tax=Chromera velia CCMP2878 TaxID=1169474 RepID=A0A0G4HIT3_9ALVE|mmetsp:Transcript_3355/g.6934  ORF Transcript_3355/g.6934 Transcript_3355/m.6934 type:complete len:398 (-) Transcript_3355:682-1875(-)|eukprot:Cvel_1079.t1-p1 / transcript=Cvel_1079.t1 / gene=Cvel_1079 / organism=Chromera_velia_CCMP2878 / gene_product=Chlorophyll synthase, chloroplastic, putative / transcript_product=Chlorophyll synthase, chloroplastic, putative / location=Cvel_scaffold35:44724-48713(+) / protein_length=397 / sequence_SO=supercontig / SO=protein_coding / is_pseudo=false